MRHTYTTDQRVAVLTELEAGEDLTKVARKYDIPPPTVRRWWDQWNQERRAGARVIVPAQLILGQMKEEIGQYIRHTIRALNAQMKVFSDEEWIRKHTAAEIAVLHGILADKFVRLLERLDQSEGEPLPLAVPDEPSFPLELAPPSRHSGSTAESDPGRDGPPDDLPAAPTR